MSSATTLLPLVRPVYPERAEAPPESKLDELGERLWGGATRWVRAHRAVDARLASRVAACERELAGIDDAGVRGRARELGKQLRRDGFRRDLVAQTFALVRCVAGRTVGMTHFDTQLMGGWVLLQGMVAEMSTGEGKTLTATLPACAAALAGVPVHIITVNDYLAARDANLMRPLYAALGLSVGVATEAQGQAERQAAYACHVTYATNKVIVFDYLRDRIAIGARGSDLRLQLDRLGGARSRVRKLLLRGLNFAIVDEADSVLVDEARTPLIISAPRGAGDEAKVAAQGIGIARGLVRGEDFVIEPAERKILLTDAGRERLDAACLELGGVWAGLLRREELARQALSALHLFARDEHYLVRDGKVEIIDEYTGRTMADRSWERGLHQLIEAKEGCEVTDQKEPLARISYQRFFRRYLHLAGMTGTAREVAGELGAVYGLPVVRVPTHRPDRRRVLRTRVYPTLEAKWQRIAQRVGEIHATGQPVLLGTRSVAASEHASALLEAQGLAHRVLNAKQDREEADIIARAGDRGCVTIATNMAGRGTDIKLGEGVAELGGLHVILSERHDAQRVDRQLAGRCARQGDPGCFEPILSIEDPMMEVTTEAFRSVLAGAMAALGVRVGSPLGAAAIRLAQRRAERAHSRARRILMKMDQQLGKVLSFSGRYE